MPMGFTRALFGSIGPLDGLPEPGKVAALLSDRSRCQLGEEDWP